MKALFASVAISGLATSAALAAEDSAALAAKERAIILTANQMASITAGQNVGVCVVCANIAAAIAANALSADSLAYASTGRQTINVGSGGGG
jgi:hypothetical protein